MGAVGVEEARFPRFAERVGARAELVTRRKVNQAAFPCTAHVTIIPAVIADTRQGEAVGEHGVAEGSGLYALRRCAREHLNVAGVFPSSPGFVNKTEGVVILAPDGPFSLKLFCQFAHGHPGGGTFRKHAQHGFPECCLGRSNLRSATVL